MNTIVVLTCFSNRCDSREVPTLSAVLGPTEGSDKASSLDLISCRDNQCRILDLCRRIIKTYHHPTNATYDGMTLDLPDGFSELKDFELVEVIMFDIVGLVGVPGSQPQSPLPKKSRQTLQPTDLSLSS